MNQNFELQQAFVRKGKRKPTKIGEKITSKKKKQRISSSMDATLIKIYRVPQNSKQKFNHNNRISRALRFVQAPIIQEAGPITKNNLPDIFPQKNDKKKLSITIKGKEDKLEELIKNYLDDRPSGSTRTPRILYSCSIDLENNPKAFEETFYTKSIEEFRGKELQAYQHDMQKNLQIEKIRLKNYRRIKLRLLST